MSRDLFALAGPAMLGWALLILLPGWRWTRRVADAWVFPAYLSLLYLVGIVPVLLALGPGVMRDFGNADGVLALLRREDLALVAWIHILAFDQVVGIMIYRDNMQQRVLPLPLMSVVLFFTLMFGRVGFLLYGAARLLRRGSRAREVATTPMAEPAHAESGPPPRSPAEFAGATIAWLRREPVITTLGLIGIVTGIASLAAIPFTGVVIAPEGNLIDTASFDIAVGLFLLTLAALVPLAGFSRRGLWSWRAWTAALFLYGYGIETVQAFRGLDPRFSDFGTPVDDAFGLAFAASAIGFIVVTAVLAARFLRGRADPLRLAIRYGFAAIGLAFAVGIMMSALQGRAIGGAGNMLPLHALGFHGMQAVPLVALLASWAGLAAADVRRLVHGAGVAWLVACFGVFAHMVSGAPPLAFSAFNAIAVAALATWGAVLAFGVLRWLRPSTGALAWKATD